MKNKATKICFVMPKTYPLFNPDVEAVFGGAEVDLYYLATELAKDEAYKVSFVTADYGQSSREIREHVHIIKSLTFKENSLVGAWKIWKAMKTADADMYFLETASTGVLLADCFCRLHRKKFIFRSASERDCNGTGMGGSKFLYNLYIRALRKAALRIVQNRSDQQNLENLFNLDSIVISNGHRFPDISQCDKRSILWVGRSVEVKQPFRFIELAQAFPNEPFVMICQKATGDIRYEDLKQQAANQPNLTFHERVDFHQIEPFFMNAKIFVNTSDSEGFPNAMLQAAKTATPMVTYQINPDGFLDQYACGLCAKGDFDRLKQSIQFLLDDNRYVEIGQNALSYVRKHHDIFTICEQYKTLIRKLLTVDAQGNT